MPAGLDRVPPPAYQLAIQGSWYGFRPPVSEKQHKRDETIPACGVDYRDATPLPQASVAILSCGGSVAPACCGRSAAHASCGGSVIPVSRGGSITPLSCGGSVTSLSRGSSIAPPSRAGSIAPLSHASSIAPPSRAGPIAPASCGGSVVPPSHGGPMREVDYATPPSREGSVLASRGSSVVPASHSRTSVTMSHSMSTSMVSNLRNGLLTATTQELGVPLNELPPLSASGYNSDEEQSQLPEHHYYGHVPLAPANDNDNDFLFESTQRSQPASGTVSLHSHLSLSLSDTWSSVIRLSTRCLPMKKLDEQRTFFETIGLTLVSIWLSTIVIAHPPTLSSRSSTTKFQLSTCS